MIFVFYSVLLNVGKGRLAKEGSLAPRTREKLSEIIRGVTVSPFNINCFILIIYEHFKYKIIIYNI